MVKLDQIAKQHVHARIALVGMLAGLIPTIVGIAQPISQFIFGLKLAGLKRGTIVSGYLSPEEHFATLFGYALVGLAIVAILVVLLLSSRQSVAVKLEENLGSFSLGWLIALEALLLLPGVSGLVLMNAHLNVLAYAMFAISCIVFVTACLLISFRLKPATAYGPGIAIFPLLIAALPLAYAFFVTPARVPNELLALPEVTILASGKQVDNISFINENKFEELYIPDPRKSLILSAPFTTEVIRGEGYSVVRGLQDGAPDRYWYDQASGRLEIHGRMSDDEYRRLLSVVSEIARARLSKKFVEDSISGTNFSNRRYNKEELEFLRLNREELERSLVLGRFFYHHVFVFQPVLSGILEGRVTSASQYGRGFTEFFSKILQYSPETHRFNNYLALLYLSYPLYLFILALVAGLMGLSRWGVAFVTTVALIGFLNSDIETIRLGVGLVPWRHFFDAMVLYCLFIYIRRPSAITGTILTAIAGLSLYWSREMGLFLAMAVMFGLALNAILSRQVRQWVEVAAFVLVAFVCYWLGNPNAATHATATMLGINTPPLPFGFMQMLALLELAVAAVWWSRRPTGTSKEIGDYAEWIFLGSALVYISLCGVYLLWYPRPHHLAPTVPVIGLAIAVAYRHYFSENKENDRKVAGTAIAWSLLLLTSLGLLRVLELRGEARVFRTHVVYEWNLPDGHITSTGQPELLSESIDVIRKYEVRSSANILSPWEIVLLPFAGKYKAGPFMITFDSLLSNEEVQVAAEQIVTSPDRFLFADTRIVRGQYELPLSEYAYMQNRLNASISRVGSNNGLRKVFELVEPCYELVQAARLISVYERKPTAKWEAGVCKPD